MINMVWNDGIMTMTFSDKLEYDQVREEFARDFHVSFVPNDEKMQIMMIDEDLKITKHLSRI